MAPSVAAADIKRQHPEYPNTWLHVPADLVFEPRHDAYHDDIIFPYPKPKSGAAVDA